MHRLQRTSRVNDKIMEYYTKFGRDRDLEKFMRLDSPAGTSTTTTSSCSDLGILRLFQEMSMQRPHSSNSMPNLGFDDEHRVINIPIRVEGREMVGSVSAEELETPQKTQPPTTTKETQTPDSIGKSHKRLEWDSLGDVGYKKSMSASNISLLERSLLRELFQENSSNTTASSNNNRLILVNASEGDLKRLQAEMSSLDPRSIGETQHNTPPLASSTFVDSGQRRSITASGTRPKASVSHTHSQGTAMTPHMHYEKYAQTSIRRPLLASQEVQVSMSSNSNSAMGNSVTPSSFESYSTGRSSATTSNGDFKISSRRRQSSQHPFVAGINEMLASRKALAEKHNNCHQPPEQASLRLSSEMTLDELHETLQRALDYNKENSNSNSTRSTASVLRSPQLDLGIQLLCSLIDAKSLTSKRKKQLVREIVKRISQMSVTDDSETVSSSAMSRQLPVSDALSMSSLDKALPKAAAHDSHSIPVKVTKPPCRPETSAKAMAKLAAQNAAVAKTVSRDSQTKPRPKIDAAMQTKTSDESAKTSTCSPACTSTPATTSQSSSSKELTTQKAVNEPNNSNTDNEQATMREWLNPMTQSEIDYEEKKRELAEQAKRAAKRRTLKDGSEREVQLTWIESEIQRLESLRLLLLKRDETDASSTSEPHRPVKALPDKIYDTVCSDQSSSLPGEAAEAMAHTIEVSVEESNENVVNLEAKKKHTRERRRETQTIYENPIAEGGTAQSKARFRSIRETIVTNEEQLLDGSSERAAATEGGSTSTSCHPRPRSKIDTPASASGDSESVGSFVQQRKREFLEQYTQKKRSHHEELVKQRQRHERQLQRQCEHRAHRYTHSCTSGAHARHYAAPPHHTYPMQHHRHVPPPPPPPLHTHMRQATSTSGNHCLASGQPPQQHYSASSMLCLSSEVSIPMGSHGSSSTPTTTHQYDDVTAAAAATIGVGVQTGDSMMRSQPIFGPQRTHCTERWQVPPNTVAGQVPACVQVKPKAISYVINFKGNTDRSSSTDVSSNSTKTKTVPEKEVLTLQEHLERARPDFLAQTKKRNAILNQLQSMRQEREREMRAIVENTSLNSLDRNLRRLPPPPTKQLRVFPTREMKARTNKRVASLNEVVQRKQREREDKTRLGNRILRDVFNRRLQHRVRNGKLSLNHSRTVI